MDMQLFPIEFELAKELVEGGLFILGIGIIRYRVQTGFNQGIVTVIKRIKTADTGMFFEDKDIWRKSGITYGSSQSGEAAADDEKRNLHPVKRLSGVAQDN